MFLLERFFVEPLRDFLIFMEHISLVEDLNAHNNCADQDASRVLYTHTEYNHTQVEIRLPDVEANLTVNNTKRQTAILQTAMIVHL